MGVSISGCSSPPHSEMPPMGQGGTAPRVKSVHLPQPRLTNISLLLPVSLMISPFCRATGVRRQGVESESG